MFFVENGTFTFVPIGLPRLDTKWIMARRNVLCSGVDISVMKAAMPILRWEYMKVILSKCEPILG